jgi:hypothetical protein
MFFDNINIDNAFRKQLGDYEQSPPPGVWDNIEHSLDSGKKPLWRNILSIAASLALMFLISGLIILQNYNFLTDRVSSLNIEQIQSGSNINEILPASQPINPGNFISKLDDERLQGRSAVSQKRDQNSGDINRSSEMRAPLSDNQLNKAKPLYAGIIEHKEKDKRSQFVDNNSFTYSYTENVFENLGSFSLPEENESKILLGSTMSPTISYRDISGKNQSEIDERSLIAYSGGVTVGYQLSERLKVKSGVFYSQIGQTLNDVEVNSGSFTRIGQDPLVNITGSMGTYELHVNDIRPSNNNSDDIQLQPIQQGPQTKEAEAEKFIVEESLLQKMEYIKLPFLLEYKIIDRNLDLSMITGINTNFLLADGIYLENSINSKKIGTVQNLSKVTYSGTIGMGVDYDINENLKISMQPLIDYYLNSYNSSSGKTYPYSFGLYTGLSFSF